MIIDLEKFVRDERLHWQALERLLDRMESGIGGPLTLPELRQFHYLYERASADLGRIATFAAEPETRRYLEALVARAYAEIHETRATQHRFRLWHWFWVTFPQAFRRHVGAFWLTVAITFVGIAFGSFATLIDPESRHVTMPFGHDLQTPSERVRREEAAGGSDNEMLAASKASFSAQLMTHNTKVSILTMSLGMSWGLGTIIMLFYNGVVVGAIGADYLLDGQGRFLAGWLLPHGSIEIPAILIAGQAGLLLGATLLGRGSHQSLSARFRSIAPDLVTLIGGVALMLVWAGIIEAFFSQYHEPMLPYSVKIAFGLFELAALAIYLSRAGRGKVPGSGFRVPG